MLKTCHNVKVLWTQTKCPVTEHIIRTDVALRYNEVSESSSTRPIFVATWGPIPIWVDIAWPGC